LWLSEGEARLRRGTGEGLKGFTIHGQRPGSGVRARSVHFLLVRRPRTSTNLSGRNRVQAKTLCVVPGSMHSFVGTGPNLLVGELSMAVVPGLYAVRTEAGSQHGCGPPPPEVEALELQSDPSGGTSIKSVAEPASDCTVHPIVRPGIRMPGLIRPEGRRRCQLVETRQPDERRHSIPPASRRSAGDPRTVRNC